ncbi:sodium/calcium exchanger protein [Moelleriella libera RCEF 2490]|uniref:Sodium/calcium exchanger protein n=1 Tax=Moelleriella libera RCEF 2490 TaxID=1081109 RepID=A0A166VKT2_9HYPO|nr:sodium/calcium exchanger protein [Moelleriella libera RCEF 2490]
MPTSQLKSRRLRSRPFVASVLLIGLVTAYSLFFIQAPGLREGSSTGPEQPDARLLLQRRDKQLDCVDIHRAEDQCSFAREYCQDEDAGLLPYLELYYCSSRRARPFVFALLAVWLGLLFTTIGIAASDFFSINLSTIATILGLSESLAGVTFLAFGNGSPDVFSTFAAMSSNSPGMAVGELIGAACFITGVVAGSMALVREFRVDKKTYARDICFFIVSVAFAMAFLADGQLRFWECWVMVAYYALYVATVVGWHWYSTRRRRRLKREGEARSHYYSMIGSSGDELAGEPYRDEPQDTVGRASRSGSAVDVSSLERGQLLESDGRDHEADDAEPVDDGEESDHERMIAAEVARSMRVLRSGRGRSHTLNPIRPSLVGALEFRSALAQLQRESNLQLSHMPGRSYSDHHVLTRQRRGTASEVPDDEHQEQASAASVASRARASSHGGLLTGSARPPHIRDQRLSSSSTPVVSSASLAVPDETSSARPRNWPSPFVVGGNLAPPPIGPPGTYQAAKGDDSEQGQNSRPASLKVLIPSRRSSISDTSSANSPFPGYTESPMVLTPNPDSERTEFIVTPAAGPPRRENSFPNMSTAVAVLPRRPLRWWPYSTLPPPHVVLATFFPTLQAWGDKTIWDKFISAISVPSIFLLVITLPVVESETTEGSVDDVTTLYDHNRREFGHLAPPIFVEPQHIEAEGEWERYRRHSGRASTSSARSPSPQVVVRLDNDHDAVGGASEGVASQGAAIAKPLSDMASVSNRHRGDDDPSSWNRWLVSVQIVTGPQFAVFVFWANVAEDLDDPGKTLMLAVLYTLLVSLVLLACLLLFTSDRKRPRYHFLLCFLGFIISIAWISTIAGEVVGVLKTFGVVLNISEALLGLTIFAAGNSVGDLVADITVARLGYPVMALSACFGGPMLNILLGIGLGGVLMMVQHANKKHKKHPDRPVQYGPYSVEVGPTLMISAVTLLMMLTLLLMLVPLNRWILSRRIGWGLIALWTLSTVANVVVEVTGLWQGFVF